MEGITEEEGLENEMIEKKTAKKGKRVLRKDCITISQLEEELGMAFIEPALSRHFEKVKTNVFETAPSSWKLEDSHRAWSQEGMKGKIEWKGKRRKEEIEDSQMEEGETIAVVNSKEDLRRWLKQEDNSTQKGGQKPIAGPLSKEIDTEMKEASEAVERLGESKHVVK